MKWFQRNSTLKEENARLQAQVATLSVDAVTGLPGRGVFDAMLETEFARARRMRSPMSILMVDIDHFKQVNDAFGHQKGDTTLRAVAQTLMRLTRASDICARYGGEEFVMILLSSGDKGTGMVAESLRLAVEHLQCPGGIAVTISIGWAIQSECDERSEEIIKRADDALYQAKSRGRNRVVAG